MRIAVFGAGGIGAYFGGRLAQAGADVELIARGPHLEALQQDGIYIESVHGDVTLDLPATNDVNTIGPCDYVLFCVKSYDTVNAAKQLPPLIHEDTAVISLQNGIGNESQLAERIGKDHVVPGVAYIFSNIANPGHIAHVGGPGRIVFGEWEGIISDRLDTFEMKCDEAPGMTGTLSSAIWGSLWEKFIFITAISGVTAVTRLPINEIRSADASRELFITLMKEVKGVGEADGVDIPSDVVSEWIEFADSLEDNTYSSLYSDIVNGNRMEVEALHGSVVRKADEHNVSVPATRTIYQALKPIAEQRT